MVYPPSTSFDVAKPAQPVSSQDCTNVLEPEFIKESELTLSFTLTLHIHLNMALPFLRSRLIVSTVVAHVSDPYSIKLLTHAE